MRVLRANKTLQLCLVIFLTAVTVRGSECVAVKPVQNKPSQNKIKYDVYPQTKTTHTIDFSGKVGFSEENAICS